jgi:hypothetical protein
MVGYVSIFRVWSSVRSGLSISWKSDCRPREEWVVRLPLRGSAWSLVASADFKSVGPALVGSVGGFDSLALPPIFVEFCFLGG